MNKKVSYILLLLIAFILLGGKVNADDTCPLQAKSKLRQMASNVTVSYVPYDSGGAGVQDADTEEQINRFALDVYIYNVNSKMKVAMNISGNDRTYFFDSKDLNEDGAIKLRQYATEKTKKLSFRIKGGLITVDDVEYDCSDVTLRTLSITLPKFNRFSTRELCADIPEYYLCQRYVTYDIDESTFASNIKKYREKLDEKANEKDEENNTSVVSKTVNSIAKYKFIVAGVIVLAGVVATVIVVKKKRSAL